jgi:hypothetical protein
MKNIFYLSIIILSLSISSVRYSKREHNKITRKMYLKWQNAMNQNKRNSRGLLTNEEKGALITTGVVGGVGLAAGYIHSILEMRNYLKKLSKKKEEKETDLLLIKNRRDEQMQELTNRIDDTKNKLKNTVDSMNSEIKDLLNEQINQHE